MTGSVKGLAGTVKPGRGPAWHEGITDVMSPERIPDMTQSRLTKPVLVVAGLTGLAISLAILIAPEAFYGSYGILLGNDPSLLNELSAPALMLLLAGGVILAGVVRPVLTRPALNLTASLFSAYALSRELNMVLHGVPHDGLILAAGVEAVIGVLAIVALRRSVHHPLRDGMSLGDRGGRVEDDGFIL